jgi:DNA-binding NtrC family response regulator
MNASPSGPRAIVGASPAVLQAVAVARRAVSIQRAPVLLSGAPGTGRSHFARAIHHAGSTAREPLVVVRCAGLPEATLERELFGSESRDRGSPGEARGLFEIAGAGTLLLAEIGDTTPRMQALLLRALENRSFHRPGGSSEVRVNCRVVAIAGPTLEEEVARGDFRDDLFFLLGTCRLPLPPLCERHGDVRLLAEHFLRQLAREHGTLPRTLSAEAGEALAEHDWPGNVRELKMTVERAALQTDDPVIRTADLTLPRRVAGSGAVPGGGVAAEIRIPPDGKTLEQIEQEAVSLTLQMTRGNRSAAARRLGISRPTLLRKIAALGSR